jgi:hypothetical protein
MIPGQPVAYPNPNNGVQVSIKFDITRHATNVVVKIYTASSRLIRQESVDGTFEAGKCAVIMNRGYLTGLSRGTYLYQLTARDSQGREAKSKTGILIIQ